MCAYQALVSLLLSNLFFYSLKQFSHMHVLRGILHRSLLRTLAALFFPGLRLHLVNLRGLLDSIWALSPRNYFRAVCWGNHRVFFVFLSLRDHSFSLLDVQCLGREGESCFICFVLKLFFFFTILGDGVNLIPITPSWSEAIKLLSFQWWL